MNLGLQNKVVFITGSSRGIGLAIAKSFLQEGANVIINARNEEGLIRVADELSLDYPGKISYIVGDVLSNEACDISRVIKNKYGKLDIFIANIGNGKPKTKEILDADEWKRFFDINILGNVQVLADLHNLLIQGGNSNVVFVSSIVAKEVSSAPVAYAAAKSAVITLSKYLSSLWALDGIRVNCVLPGNIYFPNGRWEELKNGDPAGVEEYINNNVPMKRFGTPEEVASAVTFLASERAGFITGASLSIDGGQLKSI